MNNKKLVPILIGVILIAFGIGFYSLRYNDNYKFTSLKSGNFLNVNSRDGIVKIGSGGIEVKDGDDHVVIGWDGIKVNDGNDQVQIGWNGIKINENGKSTFRLGNMWNWNWFGISTKDLKWETLDEEKFAQIKGIDNIIISSSFIDIKVTQQDRDDIRIHYYGQMKTNVIPELRVDEKSNTVNIKLETNTNSYSVAQSDVVLEVFVPKSFSSNFNISTSSSDIYMKNLIGENLTLSSSSGDIELENLEAEILNLSSSSGSIDTEDCTGEIKVSTSSGKVFLDNEKTSGDIQISTSSGDVSIKFGQNASYKIKGNTSSGDVAYNGPISIEKDKSGKFEFGIGSEDKSININTSSGDINFSNR